MIPKSLKPNLPCRLAAYRSTEKAFRASSLLGCSGGALRDEVAHTRMAVALRRARSCCPLNSLCLRLPGEEGKPPRSGQRKAASRSQTTDGLCKVRWSPRRGRLDSGGRSVGVGRRPRPIPLTPASLGDGRSWRDGGGLPGRRNQFPRRGAALLSRRVVRSPASRLTGILLLPSKSRLGGSA